MADMVSAAGLELPSLTKDSQTQLHEWIPPYLRVSESRRQRWRPRA